MSNVHIDIIIEGQGTDHKIAMKEICKDNTKSLLSNKRITTFLPAPAIQCGKQTIQKEGTINAHSTTNLRRNHNSRTIYEKKPETICWKLWFLKCFLAQQIHHQETRQTQGQGQRICFSMQEQYKWCAPLHHKPPQICHLDCASSSAQQFTKTKFMLI